MREVELVLGLLLVVAALVSLSRKTVIPYPVLLVAGGLLLALIPGLPGLRIRPDLVFLVFLPPLLYWESLTAPVRELRANIRPIAMLAIGLVLVNTLLLAALAHALMAGISWPAAFVLGAVLAPTDEVAVTETAAKFQLPRHTLSVLDGESLVNDAVSLVAFRMAVAAAATGLFSLPSAGAQFLLVTGGGAAVGLAVGWLVGMIRSNIPVDPPVENTIALLTPFAAYLPADALGLSGVIAVVAAGLYLGRVGPRVVSARTRVEARAMWGMITFLINGILFVLT
ncbi:MAG TPA: cation:proton antiporter, partial [Chthonomonadales bacterium]|nr:cation:proton antiporter [Chthonomonadales bacterium]